MMSEDTFVVKDDLRIIVSDEIRKMTPEEAIEYVNQKVNEIQEVERPAEDDVTAMSNPEVADPLLERWKAYATLAHGKAMLQFYEDQYDEYKYLVEDIEAELEEQSRLDDMGFEFYEELLNLTEETRIAQGGFSDMDYSEVVSSVEFEIEATMNQQKYVEHSVWRRD